MDEEEPSTVTRDIDALQAKFNRWLELKEQGINFNERLVNNPAFHNPNIAVKMMEFVGVNEHGTNFPPNVYDPNDFPVEADYEAMSLAQRTKWEQLNKAPPTTQAMPKFTLSKKHEMMLSRYYSSRPM